MCSSQFKDVFSKDLGYNSFLVNIWGQFQVINLMITLTSKEFYYSVYCSKKGITEGIQESLGFAYIIHVHY